MDLGYQIIDIYEDEWKAGFLRTDGLVSFGEFNNWFNCSKTADFRTHTSLSKENEDILNSYNFMNLDIMQNILSKNPRSYLEFRSYVYFGFKQFIECDMTGNIGYFSLFENISRDIFNYCLGVLKDSRVVFVDFNGKNENECPAWPEIFYFFKFFLRMTEESQDFFNKYKGFFTHSELIDAKHHFIVTLGSFRSLEYLFDEKNCLRFVYELEIFLGFQDTIVNGLNEPDKNKRAIENPYRGMLVGLNKYLNEASLNNYCPVRSRRILVELVKIVKESVKHIEINNKMDIYIEERLIELNFKAFKASKSITAKVKLAEQIDSLLNAHEKMIEKLLSNQYFSLISEHSELMQNSTVFVSYCIKNKKFKEIECFKVLKKMQNETLKNLLCILFTINIRETSFIDKLKRRMPESFKDKYPEIFIKLLGTELFATKNFKIFIEEIQKLVNLKHDLIIKYVLDVVLQENFINYTFQLFENVQFDEDSFEFELSCEVLEKITSEQFNLLIKNSALYQKVLECAENSISPVVHSKLINLIFRKQPNISQNRLYKIADIATNNEFLIEYIDDWVTAGLLKKNLDYFLEKLIYSVTGQNPLLEKYCFTFVNIIKSLYLVQPYQEISPKAAEILIEILFDYETISQKLKESVSQIIIEVLQVQSTNNQDSNLKKLIESKLMSYKNMHNIKNFLLGALQVGVLSSENIILKLFQDINPNNFDDFSEFFIKYPRGLKSILQNFSACALNNYQNYIILKIFINESYEYWKLLFEIMKQNIEFEKLGQLILASVENHSLVFNLKYEINEDFKKICRFVINCNYSGFDPKVCVENSLKLFVENEEYDTSFINTLIIQGLTDYIPSVYDPFTLLSISFTKIDDNTKFLCFLFLKENIDKFVNVKEIKPIRKFFVKFFIGTEIFYLNEFLTLIKDQAIKKYYSSGIIFSNLLKFLYSIFKINLDLDVFTDLIDFLKNEIEASTYHLIRNVKSCGLAYKFLLKKEGEIPNFESNFKNFCQIVMKTKKIKLNSYTKINRSVEKGLVNSGNVCYVNAALLILSQIPAFLHNLQKYYDPSLPLTSSLFYFYSKLYFSNRTSINAVKILNKSQQVQISLNEQRDTDEFINEILFLLSTEIGEKIYEGLQIEANRHIACGKCGQISKNVETFNRIELESRENYSISQMLKLYENKEKIDGENQYLCENCLVKVDAFKHYSLKSVPNDVIFMIKRFGYSVLLNQKIKLYDKIVMEDKIIIETEDQGRVEFQLVGIIVHSGNENAGHYFYYKKTGKNWVYINDEFVEVLEDFNLSEFSLYLKNHEPEKSTPYLLLYSKNPSDIKLNLPDDLGNKILNKNSKYLQVSLFCRPDIIEVIIELVKLKINPMKVLNYLLFSLVNIVQSESEFIRNSKRLEKVFKSLENTDLYIECLISSNMLHTSIGLDYSSNPQSYLLYFIWQILLLKSSYDLKYRFYPVIYQIVTATENVYKNLTFHIYLLYLAVFEIQEVTEEVLKRLFTYLIQPKPFNKNQFSLIYQYVSIKYPKVLSSHELSIFINNNISSFLSNLTKPEMEAFSMVLANLDQNHIPGLITKIANLENQMKFPLLIYLFKVLESKQKGYLANYFNYFEWLFQNVQVSDFPNLIILSCKSFNFQERLKLSQDYIIPRIPNIFYLNKDLIQEIEKLNQDLINPNFTISNKQIYLDPESSLSYQIREQIQNIVLLESPTNQLYVKLLYHSN